MLGMVTPPIHRFMLMRLPIIACLAHKINTFFQNFFLIFRFSVFAAFSFQFWLSSTIFLFSQKAFGNLIYGQKIR